MFLKKLISAIQFKFFSIIFIQLLSLNVNAQTADTERCLTQIEKQNTKIKECRLHQVLPDECESYLQPSILLTLQCAKSGATKRQINSAIAQGENQLSGDTLKSPYELIKKRISSSPFFIQPEKENYIAYSSQCSEFKDKLFRIVAQSINLKNAVAHATT
ncbi:MAG: hypothetical protein KZQ70_12330 [gamma proteobacterium symbiont of Lucinoma myriamae]|nr:hypothetical protein [gamma proteobacterium symbiont of Lucinoma myriamae]MCU7817753.1 hypothetical protein [gamma proteobacterium symbiont of Lucinoma myriamae]